MWRMWNWRSLVLQLALVTLQGSWSLFLLLSSPIIKSFGNIYHPRRLATSVTLITDATNL